MTEKTRIYAQGKMPVETEREIVTDPAGPRVYVGTYAKYNNGSIAGKWIDLEDYSNKEDFLQACKELHADESDPEFMFQDYEGFPNDFYNESGIDEKLWEMLALDDYEREIVEVYLSENYNDGNAFSDIIDNFAGRADSAKKWLEEWVEETGLLAEVPENLQYYFDYESFLRDMKTGGEIHIIEHDGETWIFWNH